ncbi:hypothetical protein Lalb_Chr05g0229161 [Lupinus albus]|uniref:Uncharacterized protein n=1 Tax=Lupinus albus TaxID=3870 RepID=A0A6A4QKP0_LUPAL|nr:hypothetical protein Lalb_Chr05g0229161 [Lupinus albus]
MNSVVGCPRRFPEKDCDGGRRGHGGNLIGSVRVVVVIYEKLLQNVVHCVLFSFLFNSLYVF